MASDSSLQCSACPRTHCGTRSPEFPDRITSHAEATLSWVPVRVAAMTEVDAGRQDVEVPRLEYHTKDKDDDLLMEDYDVGLLGPSAHTPGWPDHSVSIVDAVVAILAAGPGFSGQRELGRSGHERELSSVIAEGDFGLMVTGTVLPPRPVQLHQDDIKMVEPRKDAPSVTSRSSRDGKPKMASRRGDHDPSPGDSGSSNMMHETVAEAGEAVGDWKIGSHAQELEKASKPQDYVKLEAVRQDAPAPDAAEAVSLEHARLESLFTRRDRAERQKPTLCVHNGHRTRLRRGGTRPQQEASKIMQKLQAAQPRTSVQQPPRVKPRNGVKEQHGADGGRPPRRRGRTSRYPDGARNASSRRMERVRNKTKGSSSCGRTPKRSKRRNDSPPGPDSSLSSSYSVDSDSDSSSSSSDDDLSANMVATILKEVSTMLTFRPYVNSCILSGWSRKVRTQELKLKLPEAARDWFNQLPKSIQRDWKEWRRRSGRRLARPGLRTRNAIARGMRPPKSALDFIYLLNSTARKAGSDIRHPGKRLEKHVRRFVTKLRNN
ncbi:hypothetical protein GQ600_5523 [Phytophthora cactorum]|nr:hypothetical protein GQ600_5523 [Phytophthora cactorum]